MLSSNSRSVKGLRSRSLVCEAGATLEAGRTVIQDDWNVAIAETRRCERCGAARAKWIHVDECSIESTRRHGIHGIADARARAEDLAASILQRISQRLIQTIVVFNDQNSLAEKRSMVGCGEVIQCSSTSLHPSTDEVLPIPTRFGVGCANDARAVHAHAGSPAIAPDRRRARFARRRTERVNHRLQPAAQSHRCIHQSLAWSKVRHRHCHPPRSMTGD